MNSVLKPLIENKKVGILGYGREGKSTLKRLLSVGGFLNLSVIDARDVSDELPEGVNNICGEAYLECLNDFDVVFKTPGVVLPKDIGEYVCEITSETEVFIKRFGSQIIGITGTKGKSTTSSLLYHVLKESGKTVLFAGNIGIPVFDIADEVKEDTIIVIELSCHQLEYAKTCPHKAVLLNIYEDHLDHYKTRLRYGLAKKNIYLNQSPKDFLFTTKATIEEWGKSPSKTVFPSKDMLPFESFKDLNGVSLRGEHNLLNAAFVYCVIKDLGISDEEFIKAIESFQTLPHRLEFVGKINNVDYYDDSISTTVKSTISAVESIDNSAWLLVGGMERNIDYSELVEYVVSCKLKYLVCMYESGKRIFEMYSNMPKKDNSPKAVWVEDLSKAVDFVKTHACENEAVLLSPAAASYGYFKNFEERGDVFKSLVKNSFNS